MDLPVFLLFAPFFVNFLCAAGLIFVGTAVLAKFNLIFFIGIDGSEQGLPIRIVRIAIPRNPITPLVQIECLVVRVLGVPIKALVDGVEVLLRRRGHVLVSHCATPQM